MKRCAACVVLLLSVTGLACRPGEPAGSAATRQTALAGFRPIVYHRTGGLAGTDDRIRIEEDGTVEVTGRLLGNVTGKLNEFQILQLARTFEGWEKLQESYPAPRTSADAFTTEIQYGEKKVSASEANPDTPEQFRQARQRIESIARSLPAQRP